MHPSAFFVDLVHPAHLKDLMQPLSLFSGLRLLLHVTHTKPRWHVHLSIVLQRCFNVERWI